MSQPFDSLKEHIHTYKEMIIFKEDKGLQQIQLKKNKDSKDQTKTGDRYIQMVEEFVTAEGKR